MKKVYVGLSGGVDSSVCAALLVQRGFDVTGVYMKNWSRDLPGVRCPWAEDLADARSVAARLGISFKVYDFESQYREKVVGYLLAEYRAGRTPNPDIMCNQEIKFRLFYETALADGADLVATGHYAVVRDGGLWRGRDDNKDQTYFLYRINRDVLPRLMMPVGDMEKPEVRRLAREMGLPTAAKRDSQGICFVGPVGMRAFLQQYFPAEPGPIVLRGETIGQHQGAVFYTVGQRQGLGVGAGKPFYVIGKDMDSNTVYVTDSPADLELSGEIELGDLHWLADDLPKAGMAVRLRHRGELVPCTLHGTRLKTGMPVTAVAPGQSAVLYAGRRVLGGGIIRAAAAQPALPSSGRAD